MIEMHLHLLPYLPTGHSSPAHHGAGPLSRLRLQLRLHPHHHGGGEAQVSYIDDENISLVIISRFLGHKTSSIQFDGDQQLWRWRDMKQGDSVATRRGASR